MMTLLALPHLSHLAHPGYLWLFLLFIPLIALYVWHERKSHPTMRVSTTSPFSGMRPSWRVWMRHVVFALKLAAVGCLIIILCRPQTYDRWATSETEGTDIVLAVDISASMLSKDLQPSRLEAAKSIAGQFVAKRSDDNIGLVIFAGDSFTLLPMTTDNGAVVNAIQDLDLRMLDADGTAIGDGLATAINRIKGGKAKSKSIILLTDGTNNTGIVAPLTAAQIAQKLGIKIYAIGVGSKGSAPTFMGFDFGGNPVYQQMPVTIDEPTLQKMAQMTGGRYYRATDNGTLNAIFSDIDKLEKTKIDVKNFSNTQDDYEPWALLLLVLVMTCVAAHYTVLRRLP